MKHIQRLSNMSLTPVPAAGEDSELELWQRVAVQELWQRVAVQELWQRVTVLELWHFVYMNCGRLGHKKKVTTAQELTKVTFKLYLKK